MIYTNPIKNTGWVLKQRKGLSDLMGCYSRGIPRNASTLSFSVIMRYGGNGWWEFRIIKRGLLEHRVEYDRHLWERNYKFIVTE